MPPSDPARLGPDDALVYRDSEASRTAATSGQGGCALPTVRSQRLHRRVSSRAAPAQHLQRGAEANADGIAHTAKVRWNWGDRRAKGKGKLGINMAAPFRRDTGYRTSYEAVRAGPSSRSSTSNTTSRPDRPFRRTRYRRGPRALLVLPQHLPLVGSTGAGPRSSSDRSGPGGGGRGAEIEAARAAGCQTTAVTMLNVPASPAAVSTIRWCESAVSRPNVCAPRR